MPHARSRIIVRDFEIVCSRESAHENLGVGGSVVPRWRSIGSRYLYGWRKVSSRAAAGTLSRRPHYRSSSSSLRFANRIGTIVATTHSSAAAPNPNAISEIDVGVP